MKLELKVEHLLEPNIKPVLKKCQHILPSTPGAVEIVSDILQSYKQRFCELNKIVVNDLKQESSISVKNYTLSEETVTTLNQYLRNVETMNINKFFEEQLKQLSNNFSTIDRIEYGQ